MYLPWNEVMLIKVTGNPIFPTAVETEYEVHNVKKVYFERIESKEHIIK